VEAFRVDGQPVADDSYVRAWRQAQAEADRAIDRALAQDPGGTLFEGVVARTLAEHLPAGTAVFLANSMSVRYAEYFWPANDRAHPVYYSRGANGIDGTLSTAMGVAHGGAPTVLLTGDLAFLHDANGLLNAGRLRGSLTVLLINNDGGGIFEHLPIAGFEPPFETFFATPQQVDFSALCAAHGVPHEIVETKSALAAALAGEMPGGVRVLEVRTDRKADVKRCRQILREASGAVSVR
ncbi:MAG: 2-succinyl-5-enolpyruvyl-6-hydroxy-3-cyclohexene-1-carboxylic-acid synthase, partial [Verrucomicrobia bacterium]